MTLIVQVCEVDLTRKEDSGSVTCLNNHSQFVAVFTIRTVVLLYLVFVSAGVPPSDPLSRKMGALRLNSSDQQGQSPVRTVQSEAARDRRMAASVVLVPSSGPAVGSHPGFCTDRRQSRPGAGPDQTKVRSPAGS